MILEKDVQRINQIKSDLLKISQCIECCVNEKEKDIYQNIALEYSKEIKKLKSAIENTYDIKLCTCCSK